MAPSAYIEARLVSNDNEADESTRFVVDDQPYMPFLTIDTSNHDSVKHAVQQMLQLDCTRDEMDVSIVSGGITNALFCVSFPKNKAVLVRVFGAEGMINRDVENSTFAALHRAGIAPGYLGRFANGRLEEYLPCDEYRPLEVDELSNPTISKAIAVQMALLHTKFTVPEHLTTHHDVSKPSLFIDLNNWMEQALNATFTTKHDTERAQQELDLPRIQSELKFLSEEVSKMPCLQIAFCHNDLLAANIMYSPNKIQLIDFEYGGINYCVFDIANHFNEYAGGTDNAKPNYDLLPTRAQQLDFLQNYVETSSVDASMVDQKVQELLQQVELFVMINHLYWGLWGVNQASTEGCQDFDYMLYAMNRFAQYFKCKALKE